MSNYRELISEFTNRSDKVKRVTSPLETHFGITYFYYYRLDTLGNLILLTDHPDIDAYYFSEKMFLTDPYLKHPSHYRTGFFSMEFYGGEAYKEDQKKIFGTFDLHPCISFIEKHPDAFEFFGFLKEGNLAPSYYVNHLHLIKAFTKHFKNELKPALKQMEEASFSILKIVPEEHFYSGLPIIPTIQKDTLRTFLVEMGMKKQVAKFDTLSLREQQCLNALIQGKSAKETAVELFLSHRTIEHYLESCRNKLGCWTRQELFSIARQFEEMGLL